MNKLWRIAAALAAAGSTIVVLGSTAGAAAAGTCPEPFGSAIFELGVVNACTRTTFLGGTAAVELWIATSAADASALEGSVSAGAAQGVYGYTNSSSGGSRGVYGKLDSATPGLFAAGVGGETASTTNLGPGVWGNHTQSTGTVPGVQGETQSSSDGAVGTKGIVASLAPGLGSAAVNGENRGTNANGYGVYGSHDGSGRGVYGTSVGGYGVQGSTGSTTANASGVFGTINSHSDYAGGVRGENFNATCCGFGVVGFHAGQGIGIGGYAPNGFGVFGWSPNNWAAYFDGAVEVVRDLHVNGTMYASAKNFRIDDPLDPAHKYLQHASVESSQLKDIYDGVVTTDARGFATVRLPSWFEALNRDFRYQLTIVGSSFAQAIVAKEIHHNQFTIRTNKPKIKVSWQVTGIRHDPYAKAHPLQVIASKQAKEQGTYLAPRLYGQPQSKSVNVIPGMAKSAPSFKAPAQSKQK
jgi:hypothetical protein